MVKVWLWGDELVGVLLEFVVGLVEYLIVCCCFNDLGWKDKEFVNVVRWLDYCERCSEGYIRWLNYGMRFGWDD